MRQQLVGRYSLGCETVELWLVADTGGCFYFQPDKSSVARIKVGAQYESWHEVVAVALHECLEFLLLRAEFAWRRTGPFEGGSDVLLFVLDHAAFSVLCQKAGAFLSDAAPDLAEAWGRWRRSCRRSS